MLNFAVSVVATATALWKVTQLLRAPNDRGLQVVTVCTIFVSAALLAQYLLSDPNGASGSGAATGKFLQNFLLVWFFCGLICFLQSALEPEALFRWGWTEVSIALLAALLLVVTFLMGGMEQTWVYSGDLTSRPLLTFYAAGNLYMLYACCRGAYLAWTAKQGVVSAVSVSLRIAAAGLVLNAVSVHLVRLLSTTSRMVATRSIVPRGIDDFSQIALTLGIVVFSVGVLYPGTRTLVIKARLWLRDRRRYLNLAPLWLPLVRGFPSIALDGPRGWTRDRLTVFRMRTRYYRRLIECRDGLLQISPYVVEPASEQDEIGPYTMRDQASMVADALERRSRGDLPTGSALAVAAPATVDIEDDAKQLLRLSRAVQRLRVEREQLQEPVTS